ncbi:hypothetical protein LTR78_010796 [Recurvomyces mirabilis]|uniref:Uncharacterized protein n=1 Tax=Recurvomyces mirabilis TaxID=574656 RepID=A0AAE0TMN0_9PEZI|nr:hypothetical protein LTR78_010796 [Recurvomyces mirabilis]KAK5149506.1 hypothetical protein LTS14_010872 [Recurvomyces mirabilis]
MPGITDLAIETCLQIFEYLLQFKHPLKRVRKNKNSYKTRPFHELAGQDGSKLHRKTNATALLFVSKQISTEALATFYKQNVIVLSHADFCGNGQGGLMCDTSLVCRAVVHDPLAGLKKFPCLPRRDIDLGELVHQLNSDEFPKFRSVTINTSRTESIDELRGQLCGSEDLDDEDESGSDDEVVFVARPPLSAGEDAWAEYAIQRREQARAEDARNVQRDLEEYLRSFDPAEPDLQFTGVGCCNIVGDKIKPSITLRFPAIIKTWSYYQFLPWDDHDLCPNCEPERPDEIGDVPDRIWVNIQILFMTRASWLEHASGCSHAASVGMEVRFGRWMMNVREFGPGEGEAVLWKRITRTVLEHV